MAKERGISHSRRLLGAGVQPGDSRQLLAACAAHGGLAPSCLGTDGSARTQVHTTSVFIGA